MRKYVLPTLVSFAFIGVLTLSPYLRKSHPQSSAERLPAMKGPMAEEDNEEDEMDKAIEQEVHLTRDPRLGTVPSQRLIQAASYRNQKLAQQKNFRLTTAVSGVNWTERGPNNVGGRTRCLLYDLNGGPSYTKVWAGSVGGGLWYTNDITAATPVWNKADDFLGNLAITSLAQDATSPLNMYAGTGEGWFNTDGIMGLGIWKTTNGGTSWAQLAATNTNDFQFVQKVIAYTNAGTNYVLACTRSSAGSGFGGIMRSTDGGTSWTRVLASGVGGGSTSRAADIERGADGTLYCSMGIFNTDGIYRSTDNGATWTKIYTASAEYRIELACAPTNTNKVYAMVSNNAGSPTLKKVMVTSNATAVTPTWTSVTQPSWCDQGSASTDMTRGQAWYDLIAIVDPADENIVYLGGVDLMKTTNGGTNWTQISQWSSGCGAVASVHADNHSIVFKPGSSTELLAGNDGGIYRTTNSGTNFTSRNASYNVTQFYAAAIHPTSTNYFLAGAQDNGTQKYTAAGVNSTTMATGGDGAFPHIDQSNGNLQFAAYTNNTIHVSTDGGTSFGTIDLGGGSFINPTDFDDRAKILYGGNGTGTYKRWNNPAGPNGPYASVSVTAFGSGKVTHVTASPLTANRVYFGLDNGRLVRVDNAHTGSSATGVIMFTNPSTSTSVSSVAIDPSNEDHMLVTYSNYGITSIYESFNATSASPSFSSLDNNGVNLPDMPIRWAMFDPRNSDWALIATELGVWSTTDLNGTATDWQPTNTGFANVRVDMLQYRPTDGLLLAATHGRGIFTASIPISKSIMFSTPGSSDTESSATGTSGCSGYKEYDVPLMITAAPVGNATVTISVSGNSTATQGVDFDFTTNGNFASPSNTITFLSGSAAAQTFKLRVYNDDIVESSEGITFSFSVTGSDAVRSSYNSSYVFVINDNDVNAFSSSSADYTVGVNSLTTYLFGINGSTGSINNNRGRVQCLYLASELQNVGLKAGSINAVKFTVSTKNSSGSYTGFTVSMANSSNTTLNSGFTATGLTQVYTGNLTTAVGVNTINLTTPFTWDGTSNIVVQFCYDNAAGTISNDYVNGTSLVDDNFYQVSRVQTTAGTGCNLGAEFGYTERIDLTFTLTNNATSVESVLNSAKTLNIGSSNCHNFYSSADGELMVAVNNASANLGCVTARVDEAGTTWQSFLGGQRSQKVYEVTPSANSGASYAITLYYTNAELAGKSPATLKIMKTSAASASAANTANSVTVTPTVTDYGSYKAFTANFTGFSRFFLIDNAVILPLVLKEFSGKLNVKAHTDLTWTTAFETNTKEFVVERSTDGNSFEVIGTVNATGNNAGETTYKLTDPYPAEEVNYYKLKMVDWNGHYTYSPVIVVNNPARTSKNIRVVTNPFTDHIQLFFSKIPSSKIAVRLIDMSGRIRYSNTSIVVPGNRWNLDVLGLQLAKGNYIMEVTMLNEKASFKLIKE